MLTASEKRWLRGRELSPRPYCASCINAKICAKTRKECWCPTDGIDRYDAHILRDALAFSERVAALLASWEQNLIIPCMETAVCERHPQDCPWCRMKYARLQVEMEMDSDDQ